MVLKVLDGGVWTGEEEGLMSRVLPPNEERGCSIRAPDLEHLPIAIRLT
jgi:hypothetical protein